MNDPKLNHLPNLQKYVLTAMHCVFDLLNDYEGLVVLAGLHDICTAAVAIPFQRRTLEVSMRFTTNTQCYMLRPGLFACLYFINV